MSEILDIYDENMTHIGIKARNEVHRDGDWHKVIHCWVIYRDDEGQDWIILQKRGPNQDTYPNMLDISAAGHYQAGETAHDGVRELEEELGLSAQFEDLIPLGVRIGVARYEDVVDRQFADVFFYICNQSLKNYKYQESEITGLIALNVEQGFRLLQGEIECINAPAVGYDTDLVEITNDNFIKVQDHYFEKILLLATRCLDGETYLFI